MSSAKTRRPRRKSARRPKQSPKPKQSRKPKQSPQAQAKSPSTTTTAQLGPLRLRATAITHRGKVRAHNEDCVGVCEWSRRLPMTSPLVVECLIDEPRLCMVADGLGGHAGGELASFLAVRRMIQASPSLKSGESVLTALREANKLMYEAMNDNPEFRSMGSTAVGVALFGAEAWLFNVGDSRGYLSSGPSGESFQLISTDDTSEPRATAEERTGQRAHSITQCLGGQMFFGDIHPHVVARPLTPGDRYLLCSDGLTDMLDMAGIKRCLQADPRATVEKLLNAALDEGGHDNISIVLVDILALEPAGSASAA